ncbi:MAG: hypothetical protein AAF988_07325 [Pseudomonadota bacterium]
MPLDDLKANDGQPTPLTRTFASPGKRYVAIYFAAPTWGDESSYKAWSRDPNDPGTLRFIKKDDLGAIATFDPQKAKLPEDCIAVGIFVERGRRKSFYMYGDIIPAHEGASIEQSKALRNGIEIFNNGMGP